MSVSTSSPGQPNPSQEYLPSVPISVYRQLSQELQNTKERLTQVQAEQSDLISQNQTLKQELRSIVELNQELQQVVFRSANQVQEIGQRHQSLIQALLHPPQVQQAVISKPDLSATNPPVKNPPVKSPPVKSPQPTVVKLPEQASPPTTTNTQPLPTGVNSADSETGINSWWLALTMLIIVLISFGAGHFLVKSLINRS